MGELFPSDGLRVPALDDEQKLQRISAFGSIINEIDANLGLARPHTLVGELEAERYRLAADRTILSKQLSSVALEGTGFTSSDYAVDLLEQLERV